MSFIPTVKTAIDGEHDEAQQGHRRTGQGGILRPQAETDRQTAEVGTQSVTEVERDLDLRGAEHLPARRILQNKQLLGR